MSKIHVLYVGNDDWTTKYSIPDNIEFEVYESDESEPSTNRPARKLMDLVILDRDITLSEEKKFTKFTRGYCLFATENVQMLNSATSRYFKARMGQYLYTGDVQYFLAHEVRNYYPNPYGEKFNPAKLAISDSFTGRVSCEGNYNLLLEGEFGEDFSQIAYWRYNTDYVTDKLNELGLTKDELVLSGASMGTFGSLYYGSKLSPHALLLAKPLANMGNVARNERILRAGGFATSLDILMKNYDNLSEEAIEQLNNRMWDRFDSADWSQTKFIISYLYEDDYDPDGYPSILSHLKSSGVEVYGKGSHGRHTDNSANVMAWFKSQYNNLLHDDFSR